MIRILVADDDTRFVKQLSTRLKTLFDTSGFSYELVTRSQLDEPFVQTEFFDIAYLDIEMPVLDGFLAAQQLTRQNPRMYLIFITAKNDLVYRSFAFHPYDFIRKEDVAVSLDYKVQVLIERLKKQAYYHHYNGVTAWLPINQILYLRKENNDIYFHTAKDSYRERKRLNTLQQELNAIRNVFVRINKSELVNLEAIKERKEDQLLLTDGSSLSVSRALLQQLLSAYQKLHEQDWMGL